MLVAARPRFYANGSMPEDNAERMHKLSDHEGTFLSLVLRLQPTTAYQVAKVYDQSPVTNYKTHKGKIYPIIERLVARNWLAKQAVASDRRGTEHLFCTAEGEQAVRAWVNEIQEAHLLLDDPLRTKIQSFGLLTQSDRIAWVVRAKALLAGKLAELEAYGREVDVPFKRAVHDNAVRSLRARMDWLDALIFEFASGEAAAGPSAEAMTEA